jgi:hemoglobin/transferrin/lactoferrin receptor protein
MRAIFLLLPVSLAAQEILPEVVVTANRSTEEAEEVPYSLEILTAEELLENATRTLPQAFLNTPGVLVQQTTTGHGSPYIRGFTGRQNLLLQDGIRLNNSTWRSGPVQYWNTLDAQAIDRLELIKSQGSVLFGSDAIGGTVNTLSKSSGFRDEEGFFSGGAAYYRFDTNSKSHLGRIEQRFGAGGKWGVMLGYSASDIGNIRDSALGTMRGTGYSQLSHDLKFEYAFSPSQTLTLAHSYLDQDNISRWHNTINNPGWTHGRSFTTAGTDLARDYDQERSLTYLRFEDSDASLRWIDRYQATVSFQRTQDSEFRVRGSGRSDTRVLDVDTFGLSFQAETGNLVWGADYYHDQVDSQGFRNGIPRPSNRPIADDAIYDSLGIFTNYTGTIGQSFTYDAGARFTYIEAQWDGYRPDGAAVDQSGDGSWDNLALSLRGQYELDDSWTIFGGASQAFRAPNLDDLTGRQFSLNGLDENGSPDVDPEKYLTTEIGTRYNDGNFSFELSGYYTFIDDGIVRIDDGLGGLATTNGSEGFIYGFDGKTTWNFHPQWRFLAHASWQDGEQKQGGVTDTIRRLNPLNGAIDLRWTAPSEDYWISGRVQAATRQDNLSLLAASDTQRIPVGGTPGYVVASLYGGWQVSEALQLNLALENLTDEDYRIHGSGQNMPGRNATLSVKFEW